jgi:Mrp family chromosome partitioning ATPase
MAYSPNSPEKIQREQQAIDQQLKESEARVRQYKAKIDELTEKKSEADSGSDIADINQTLEELNKSWRQEQETFSSLLNYKNSSVVNSLTIFEQASPDAAALPSKRNITIAFAAFAGMLLSFLAVFILDRFDNRWRGGGDVKDRFEMDDLGNIPIGPPLLVAPQPFAAERMQAARDVQTNILLAAAEHGARSLMITSPQPSESRAAFAIDMADLFARSGSTVLIVDVEFTNSFLTRMLTPLEGPRSWTVKAGNEHNDILAHLRPTPMRNVALLPAREQPDDMPAMLSSARWRELVQRLVNAADVIIIDGPATLNGPDAALLAPHVDGVVLALDPTVDDRETIAKSKSRLLHQKGAHLLGAVTFTPTQQRSGLGSVWQQLQGKQQLALPAATAPHTTADTAEMYSPIVASTPADEARASTTRDASAIITVSADVVEVPADEIEPTLATNVRRRRKAARVSQR